MPIDIHLLERSAVRRLGVGVLAGVLKFFPADTAACVSAALLASALGAPLQTTRPGPVGSGLLGVTGTSFSFLQPLVAAGQAGGLALMFGMPLAAAALQPVLNATLPDPAPTKASPAEP